jgi:hypothetical protein
MSFKNKQVVKYGAKSGLATSGRMMSQTSKTTTPPSESGQKAGWEKNADQGLSIVKLPSGSSLTKRSGEDKYSYMANPNRKPGSEQSEIDMLKKKGYINK